MAENNLRAIYKNLVDLSSTTLTASSTASASTTVANLKSDAKSVVWRSATSTTTLTKANLVVNFGSSASVVGGVILAFTNLSSQVTVRVRGYTGSAPTLGGTVDVPVISATGVLVFDTGHVAGLQPQGLGEWNWGLSVLGPTAYPDKSYVRVWVPQLMQLPCTSIVIEIIDPYNVNKYVEVSRVIVGQYWSPQYNTSYGLGTKVNDLTTSERAESGDLITINGAIYNSMTFDLKYLSKKDRVDFNTLVKSIGTKKPVFISLFPDNTSDTGKEQMYQMYGKLSQLFGIEHPIFDMYSSQVELEEV